MISNGNYLVIKDKTMNCPEELIIQTINALRNLD